jgi:hypothetical protein
MISLKALEPDHGPDCLSDFAFDRWLAGLASAEESAAFARHRDDCVRCAERHATLWDERRAWQTAKAAKPAARWPRDRTWIAASAGVGLVVAALLAVRGANHAPEVDATRSKGAQSIGFFVKHGAAVRRGVMGDVVAPGDALRFTYTSDRPGATFLAVLSVDGAGRASVYYPSGQPARAVAVAAGRDVLLPISTVLDGVLGDELLIGLFCNSEVVLDPWLRALEQDVSAPPPPGCSTDRLSISKREVAR